MSSVAQEKKMFNSTREADASATAINNSNKGISFSKIVSNSLFPKKNQAIIIDTVEGVEVKMYLKAIATKTASTNIVASSKIAQNRLCCYLNDAKLVEELTSEGNNIIEIDGQELKMRPYVTKSRRVIFSNVHPCIPHDDICAKMKEYGVTPKSNMNFIRLGFNEPGFTHILSFRRQIFIDPDDVDKLPKEFSMNYDESIHHIYVSTDKITCFVCQQEGHTAKYCPKYSNSQIHSSTTHNEYNKNNDTTIDANIEVNKATKVTLDDVRPTAPHEETSRSLMEFNGTTLFKKPIVGEMRSTKRPAPSSTTSASNLSKNEEAEGDTLIVTKKMVKKKKTNRMKNPPEDLANQINTAKNNIPESIAAMFPVTFKDLHSILLNSYNIPSKELPTEANRYTTNRNSLVIMLQEVYKHITITELKQRITRIINQLLDEELEFEDSQTE